MMRVLFSFYILLGLYNILPNSKRYVMEPKGFMGYHERGSAYEWVVFDMTNTPPIAGTKRIEPVVFVEYPNEGITFLLGFGMAMQYPYKFQ